MRATASAAVRPPPSPAGSAPLIAPARRRPPGPSFGPVPLSCVVVVELGLAAAVLIVAADRALLPVAGIVLSGALLVGLLRRRDRWVVRWIALGLRYRLRVRDRDAEPLDADADVRLRALRLVAGDLTVTRGRDHDGREVGLVGHEGVWSAVLTVDAAEAALAVTDDERAPTFPLGALADTLADRGVVLDSLTALWHHRPGGAGLPADSPAVAAYREILGPLPDLARRDAHLVVRLDPARCPHAVLERGGGVLGAQRALLGALARIERVLVSEGLRMRPLGSDEVLRAALDTTALGDDVADPDLRLREHWGAVVVGSIGHATFAVTRWPPGDTAGHGLPALSGLIGGAEATVLALTLGPGTDDPDELPGLRAAVRVVAGDPEALEAAGAALVGRGRALGITLDPLDGQHTAGLVATLPLGTAP